MGKWTQAARTKHEREQIAVALGEATTFAFDRSELSPERCRELMRILIGQLGKVNEKATAAIVFADELAHLQSENASYEREVNRLVRLVQEFSPPAPWDNPTPEGEQERERL